MGGDRRQDVWMLGGGVVLSRLCRGETTLSLAKLRLRKVESLELIVEDRSSLLPSFPGLREGVGAVDRLT